MPRVPSGRMDFPTDHPGMTWRPVVTGPLANHTYIRRGPCSVVSRAGAVWIVVGESTWWFDVGWAICEALHRLCVGVGLPPAPPPLPHPGQDPTPPQTLAARRWPDAEAIVGDGPWATAAHCQGYLVVHLHESEEAGLKALDRIDTVGCGSGCTGDHELVDLWLYERPVR